MKPTEIRDIVLQGGHNGVFNFLVTNLITQDQYILSMGTSNAEINPALRLNKKPNATPKPLALRTPSLTDLKALSLLHSKMSETLTGRLTIDYVKDISEVNGEDLPQYIYRTTGEYLHDLDAVNKDVCKLLTDANNFRLILR